MNQSVTKPDSETAQPIIYAYPQPSGQSEDVDLMEAFVNLIKQWRLMALVFVCGGFLVVMLAFVLTRYYKVDTTLSLPTQADVSPFNMNDLLSVTPKSIFRRYYDQVRSRNQFSSYVKNNGYLPKLFPEQKFPDDQLIKKLRKKFSIVIEEPLPEKGRLVDEPERITLSLMHSDEALVAELLTGYVKYVGQSLVEKIADEQKKIVAQEIKRIEAEIEILRISAKAARLADIARISAENNERIDDLNQRIKAVVVKAAADTKDRVVQIRESREIAESLGIIYPTELKELKKNDVRDNSLQTLIQVNDNESLPLFLMGTRYLDSLISSIEERKNEAAFISSLNDFRKEIVLLENDAKLAALKARVSDDPYIEELPDLQAKVAGYRSLSFDYSQAKAYSLDQDVLLTGIPSEPDRLLVVVVGIIICGLVALFVGVFAVLVRSVVKSNQSE